MGVGKRIRDLRKASGLRQGELARRAGMSQSALSDLERGDTTVPRGDSLVGLAVALKVSHQWLMSGEGSPVELMQPDLDESELLQIYKDLSEPNRAALVGAAKAMLGTQPKPTRTSPLKRVKQ